MNLGIHMMLIGIVALLVSVVMQLYAIRQNQVALGELLKSIRKQIEKGQKNGNDDNWLKFTREVVGDGKRDNM